MPIHPNDMVAHFTPSSFVSLETQDEEITVAASGSVIFRPEDPECVPTLTGGCLVTISLLRVDLADFSINTPEGTVTYESVMTKIVSDDDLINEGAGAYLPPGDRTATCGMASGEPFATTGQTDGLTFNYDVSLENLTIQGELIMNLDYGDPDCTPLKTTAFLSLGGARPWLQGGQ